MAGEIGQLTRQVADLQRRLAKLEAIVEASKYQGTQASDFTGDDLTREGDYGFQSTDDELQMQCAGTILKTAMTAL